MSKTILLPNTALRQTQGNIIYQMSVIGEELSLQVDATAPMQADLVCISGTMNFLARIIQSSEEAAVPKDKEEERQLYLDGLRSAYAILSSFNKELSKANINEITRLIK